MNFYSTDTLTLHQKQQINELWNREYPAALNHKSKGDFEDYLSLLSAPSHIVVYNKQGDIKGWYFDFMRDEERWFAMILDSEIHGKGVGSQLLNMAKDKHQELNGWVIDHNQDLKTDGTVYQSPLEFYLKNGFHIKSKSRLELEEISAVQIHWISI